MNTKLHLINNSAGDTPKPARENTKALKRIEATAHFDRLWLNDPEQFNPMRNCLERERVTRSWELLKCHVPTFVGSRAIDLGCGAGYFARKLWSAGANVDAVDISSNALKRVPCEDQKIKTIQDYVPNTTLEDDSYDIVVSTELIGYLPPEQHRLYISELARLIKKNGVLLCSTALDIDSQDALQLFANMVQSEFDIIEWQLSYHRLYLTLKRLLTFPALMVQASSSPQERQKLLATCKPCSRWWYRYNSAKLIALFWKGCDFALKPLIGFWRNNGWLLLQLEKLSRLLWNENGISHAAFVGKRRPLLQPTEAELQAIEPRHKKQVWE